MTMRSRVPPLVWALLLADVALAAAFVGDRLAGQPFPPLSTFLSFDAEANLPAWYSSMQWFATALLFGLFAARNVRRELPRSWLLLLLPALFALLSLDEVAQLHEWLGRRTDFLLPSGHRAGTPFRATGIWMLAVGVPFAAVFFGLVYGLRAYFAGSKAVLVRVCIGMGIMLAGALGVETLSNFVARDSAAHTLQLAVEELAEMIGGTLILWGGLGLLSRRGLAFEPLLVGTPPAVPASTPQATGAPVITRPR